MSRRHCQRYTLGALLSLLITACASTPPVPNDHYYRLSAIAPPQTIATPAISGVLKIEPIKSYGIYRERALLYTQTDHPEQLQQYRYHYWIDTPSRLIRDQLVEFLRASGIAEGVAGSQLPVSGDLRLKLALKAFERVINPTGPDRVRVALDALLTNTEGQPLRIVSYQREAELDHASIAASVIAINHVLNQIYLELLNDLQKR
jgi:ABC-type uncharacterized transport system auxiliary subunit